MKQRVQLLLVGLALCAPSLCSAQVVDSENNKLRLEGFFRLGFAGEVDAEVGSTTFESDLELGFGLGAGLEYLLHPNFSIGARGQVLFTEVGVDNSDHSAIDFNIVPKGRFPLEEAPVSVYASIPFGLSIISSEVGSDESDTETGFNIGVLFGVDFFVSSTLGFLVELGYQWHFFSRQALGTEIDLTAGNLLLQAGAKFAF